VSTPTINRTGLIPTNDDGSGTTGTKWNAAYRIALLDAIDAMFATSFKQKSANYTVLNTDNVIQVTSGSITLTLHAANDATRGNTPLWIKNSGTGTVTVDGAGSETIDGQLTFTLGQYDSFILVSTGTEWIIF
jgi:hypothetical protein